MNPNFNSLVPVAVASETPPSAATETVTILRSAGPAMAKTWKADGTMESYSKAWQFKPTERVVSGLGELARLLDEVSQDRRCCLVRGKYIGDAVASEVLQEIIRKRASSGKADRLQPGYVPRIGELFEDHAQHAIMLDVDGFDSVLFDCVNDAEMACRDFVAAVLPAAFHSVSFYWTLSGSAGRASAGHKLKAHIWFWLEKAHTSAQLRAWAEGISGIDKTVYHPVQVHYIAHPQLLAAM